MKIVVKKDERTIDIAGGVKLMDVSGDKPIIDGKELEVDIGEGRVHKKTEVNGRTVEMDANTIINIDHIDTFIS